MLDNCVEESQQGSHPSGLAANAKAVAARRECLTKPEELWQSSPTAATDRRAMERPPQPGFHWRRG